MIKSHFDPPGIYFLGHSMGAAHKQSYQELEQVMDNFTEDYATYDTPIRKCLAQILGTTPNQVACSASLTQCMHICFSRFYNPTKERTKIMIDRPTFPSDVYAMKAQITNKGLNPEEHLLLTESSAILETLHREKDKIAVIFLQGVNYLTGEFYEMQEITDIAHSYGITVGWDLAHATGNVPLYLDQWGVDFATFCTYKFLNCGPHTSGGLYVNQKHLQENASHFKGWAGSKSEDEFIGVDGANRFNLTPPSPVLLSFWVRPLEEFARIGMEAIRKHSIELTEYLAGKLAELDKEGKYYEMMTPKRRGATVTLQFRVDAERLTMELKARKVYVDFRKPNCMRVCASPLYNTREEVDQFVGYLKELLEG